MENTLKVIIKNMFGVDVPVTLTRPEEQFGDFSTSIALQLAKPLGKSPREIASQIVAKLQESSEFVEVSVAGPGFINIRLSDNSLLDNVLPEIAPSGATKSIVLEYSCPNAFKELHTGHLYQTIFGDILARLLEKKGHTVHRTSFGSDVGLPAAKCLWGIRSELEGEYPEKLRKVPADVFERARWLSACYVKGATAYENDENDKATIDELNKTIYGFHSNHDHESPLAQLYWETREWSFAYFDAFYTMINVMPLAYYPESLTTEAGIAVVTEQLQKGTLKQSDGAIVFEGDESKHLHTRVFITSKGLPTYETKDIGVIWSEKADYDFDHRIVIIGNDQKEYMRVVFAAAETFRPELAGTMTHLTNGIVQFGDGQKMSSRLGNVTRAIDVIDTVRAKVKTLVEDEETVELITLGAVKYVFAKYRFGGDIAFDVDETVTLQGNSGPYLQYAHARARGILTKSEKPSVRPAELDPVERSLARKLTEYQTVVHTATEELMPHLIANYLYELAQNFNSFYEGSRVIGDEREEARLWLVENYADILKNGLGLLGIEAPAKI